MENKKTKYISKDEALSKLIRYCSYQDRCHQEVRNKLIELNIYGEDLEDIISELISSNYLNEERFARSFVRGKFKLKKWGRVKIKMHLKQKNISEYLLKKSFEEIEEEVYLETIEELLMKSKYDLDIYDQRQKAKASLHRKGYELHLIHEVLRKLHSTH